VCWVLGPTIEELKKIRICERWSYEAVLTEREPYQIIVRLHEDDLEIEAEMMMWSYTNQKRQQRGLVLTTWRKKKY